MGEWPMKVVGRKRENANLSTGSKRRFFALQA